MDTIKRCPHCGVSLDRKTPPSPPALKATPTTDSDEKMFDKMLDILHLLVDKNLRWASGVRLSTKTFREILTSRGLNEAQFFDILGADICQRAEFYPDELRYQLVGILGDLGYEKHMARISWPPPSPDTPNEAGEPQ